MLTIRDACRRPFATIAIVMVANGRRHLGGQNSGFYWPLDSAKLTFHSGRPERRQKVLGDAEQLGQKWMWDENLDPAVALILVHGEGPSVTLDDTLPTAFFTCAVTRLTPFTSLLIMVYRPLPAALLAVRCMSKV